MFPQLCNFIKKFLTVVVGGGGKGEEEGWGGGVVGGAGEGGLLAKLNPMLLEGILPTKLPC